MNPALSLLIVYLKNYGSIAEAFNPASCYVA